MTVRRPIVSGSWLLITCLLAIVASPIHAFHVQKTEQRPSLLSHPTPRWFHVNDATASRNERLIVLWSLPQTGNDDDDDNQDGENSDAPPNNNPYADPNYPDLEFVDYSNPNYMVDQGDADEFYPRANDNDDDTDEMIEAMREERRRKNDEYQFETYYAKVLQEGQEYRGEWTIYQTDTFLPTTTTTPSSSFAKEEEIAPRLVPSPRTLQVISKGYKIQVEDPSQVKFRVDAERICHVERMVVTTADEDSEEDDTATSRSQEQVEQILRNQYWPLQLCARDFRGDMGIMCVGNAYTICTSRPLAEATLDRDTEEEYVGPFAEHWTELGLSADRLRLRIKLHYSVLPDHDKNNNNDNNIPSPPLYLKSLTVCREMLDMWPSDAATTYPVAWEALFGSTGAPGGLFDPPPVGSADQARHYRLIELPGRATILIPVQLDQDEAGASQVAGWVTSLDWTSPLAMRYQVDRKVKSGNYISGLRTLELSEIQSENVEQYRPRDGGQDMRQ